MWSSGAATASLKLAANGALRETRDLAAHALAAPIASTIARTALAALRLFGEPFHDPFHDRSQLLLFPLPCGMSQAMYWCHVSNPTQGCCPGQCV